jgi:hypothetical protein
MKNLPCLTVLIALSAFSLTTPVFAQETSPAPPAADKVETKPAEEKAAPASQEVEINEDSYRQFMELKDANRQGDIIPENVFKPGSGLQKLEKLPEESQKHLRNELREIIVQGDPWQPGDERAGYPYVPSEAASRDPALQKQEMEAWGELVDSYNQREAQIYENASRTHAARTTEDGNGENPGEGANPTGGTGQDNEGSRGQQASQENNPGQTDTAGTYSPNAINNPNAQSASGVSQNAMEFLQGRGQAGSSASAQAGSKDASGAGSSATGETQGGQAQSASSQANADGQATAQASGQGEEQADKQADAQADAQANGPQAGESGEQGQEQANAEGEGQALDGQQSETAQKPVSTAPSDIDTPAATVEPAEESSEGSSQNALEYLTGERVQTGEAAGGEADTSAAPAGTLNIQDLLNIQGVGGSLVTAPATPAPDEKKPPDETKTDKDGGGR